MKFSNISYKQFQKITFLTIAIISLCWTGCQNDDDDGGSLGLEYVVVYNLSTAGTVDLNDVFIVAEDGTEINLGPVRDINEILSFPSGSNLRLRTSGVVREGLIDARIRATPPGGSALSVIDAAFNGAGELDSLPFNFDLTLRLP